MKDSTSWNNLNYKNIKKPKAHNSQIKRNRNDIKK